MNPDARAKLLELIEGGHTLAGAARLAGLAVAAIRQDAALMREVAEADLAAISKMRAKMLAISWDDGDSRTLGRLLEQREKEHEDLAAAAEVEADGGRWRAKLAVLTDAELDLLDWLEDPKLGPGERPARGLTDGAGEYQRGWRQGSDAAVRHYSGVPSDLRMVVDDPEIPLAPGRSLVARGDHSKPMVRRSNGPGRGG
jgi:hypothetical protein